MFAKAIELVGEFTRPIKIITRNYKSSTIVPGSATLFFINENGYAITCKHVVEELIKSDSINQNYYNFKEECAQIPNNNKRNSAIKKLEQKYNLKSNFLAEMKIQFPNCVDTISEIKFLAHPQYDIAIIHFVGFKHVEYQNYAILAKNGNNVNPGDFLCRLGFPFPEFSDFNYNESTKEMDWDPSGRSITPRFPIEGMFTRHTGDEAGNVIGIELSTPGLRGQSGGPLFDSNGIIYGMQSMTNHLHLGFDMKKEKIMINGKEETINNQPFLHVGQCVHVDIIKDFLNENGIKYYIGDSIEEKEIVNG